MPYDPNDYDSSNDPATRPTQAYQPPPNSPYRYAWQQSQQGQQTGDMFRDFWKRNTGKEADDDLIWNQYLNWDKAPDAVFQQKLLNQMYGSDEAKAFRAGPAPDAPKKEEPAPKKEAPPPATASGSPVTADGKITPQPAYTARTPLPSAYQPGQVAQYQAPNQSQTSDQTQALLSSILSNPQTMNPNVVAQMKEAQKEQALLMQRQNQSTLDQHAIARGTLGSGANQALAGQNLQQALDSILGSNRAIDMQAAQQNRQDELAALNAGNSFLNDQLSRSTQAYGTQLQGQLAQEQLKQQGFRSGLDLYNADLATEFGRGSANLDVLRYLENQRQFNNNLKLNWAQLDQQGQLGMLQWLLG